MSKVKTPRDIQKMLSEDKEGWMCTLPFRHIYSNHRNEYRVCCRGGNTGEQKTIDDMSPIEWFNSDYMNKIRDEMISGELTEHTKSACSVCVRNENSDIESYRQYSNKKFHNDYTNDSIKAFLLTTSQWTEERKMEYYGRSLDIKVRIFGNLCNLQCYMCHPVNSTSRITELGKLENGKWYKDFGYNDKKDKEQVRIKGFDAEIGSKNVKQFYDDIDTLMPHLESIKIIGGEPLIMKNHYQFLDKLVNAGHAQHMKLSYDSNLTKFKLNDYNFLDYIGKFKHIHIGISLDGLDEKNDWIRYPSKFEQQVENIRILKTYNNISFQVNPTVSILNVGDLEEIHNFYVNELGTKVGLDINVLRSPDFLDLKHLPEEIKQQFINKYEALDPELYVNIINALKEKGEKSKFDKFVEYANDLDIFRGNNRRFTDIWPHFKPYV